MAEQPWGRAALSITFSEGRETHIVLAAVPAVHAGVRVAGGRGILMRKLLVGLVLKAPALVVVAIGAAR
jgi:hypothetical protein